MAKRSIPISEIIDTPRNEASFADCTIAFCRNPVDKRMDFPICTFHVETVLHTIKAPRTNQERHREQQRRDRNGIPKRGSGKPACMWPQCPSVESVGGTQLCRNHADRIVGLVQNDRNRRKERAIKDVEERTGAKLVPVSSVEQGPKAGVIYYVQVTEHIKIGWTTDLGKRMKAYPPNSRLLATEPGYRADEAKRHKQFAVDRAYGNEWYVPSVALLHHIDMIKRKHGEPSVVVVGAKPVTVPEPRDPEYIGGPNNGYSYFRR